MNPSEKFQEFAIVYDNPNATFYPGQQVTGHVRIDIKKSIKTTGIYVRYLGTCFGSHHKSICKSHGKLSHYKQHYDSISKHGSKESWGAQTSFVHQASDNEQRKYYKDTEVYFDTKERIWGTDKVERFGAGAFNLAFQFCLPNNLPTSYEGDRGYIRYVVMATISRSWNSPYRIFLPFTVISNVDLNIIPGIEKPVTKHEVRKFGFLIFKAGSISASIGINKKGYVPGETIIFNGDVKNGSVSRISKSITHLVSVTTYRVSGKVFQSKQSLCDVEGVSIPSRSSWELRNIHLKIPPSPPSGLGGCGLISVDYQVELTLITEMGCVAVNVPIIIGTIPLKTDFAAMLQPPDTKRKAPPRPPPPAYFTPENKTSPSAPDPSLTELQSMAKRRLAKEEEALGIYRGVDTATSQQNPSTSFDLDLLTGDLACANVTEDNTTPLTQVNQISTSAVSEMYPDLPPPSYEECVYGERINISDDDEGDDDNNSDESGQVNNFDLGSPSISNNTTSGHRRHSRRKREHRNTFAPSYVFYHQFENGENT